MHLETLRLYCDVVRLRSFSRGAELNYVSQSAASQAVQQLEGDLGVTLIDRTKRPFLVTAEGRAFFDSCRALLDGYEKAKAGITAMHSQLAGTVRVAAIYSVGLHDLIRHVQRFMALYPEARVQLECLHPHKVVDAVLSDSADVGIMSYPPTNRALSVVPLRSEPMAFVCHPAHRLARRRVVAPEDLVGEPFVAFDPGLTIRKAIDRALRHAEQSYDPGFRDEQERWERADALDRVAEGRPWRAGSNGTDRVGRSARRDRWCAAGNRGRGLDVRGRGPRYSGDRRCRRSGGARVGRSARRDRWCAAGNRGRGLDVRG